jgi:3',5'-cyclic AMP phosphodiesterase CpdA
MTAVCWVTDVHLDMAEDATRRRFFARIEASAADAVLVTGDIADGPKTGDCLCEMADRLARPIYFVLGNHDFYGGSIREVEERTVRLADDHPYLVYLPAAGVVEISPGWGLVGEGGWPDARLGDYEGSKVFLPDFVTIEDLAAVRHDRPAMRRLLAELGDRAARRVAEVLPQALAKFPQVVLATHVPPFRRAAWHQGHPCDDDWLPYFSCQAMGDVLLSVMQAHPDRRLVVLCGHTHGAGRLAVLDSLLVLTGGAESGKPAVQKVFEFNARGVQPDDLSW